MCTQDALCHDHPKMKELIDAKQELTKQRSTPAYALQADLATLPLNTSTFGTRFDVVIIDPPWEEYARRCATHSFAPVSQTEANREGTTRQVQEQQSTTRPLELSDATSQALFPCIVFRRSCSALLKLC